MNLSERNSSGHASPLPVYLDDVEMDAEMEMVLLPLQSRYYYKYSGPEEFLDSLKSSAALQTCREATVVEWDTISFAESAVTVPVETPEDWFRLAAEQGRGGACFFLGEMCEQGLGVAKDIAQALQWYLLAKKNGYRWADTAIFRCEKALKS